MSCAIQILPNKINFPESSNQPLFDRQHDISQFYKTFNEKIWPLVAVENEIKAVIKINPTVAFIAALTVDPYSTLSKNEEKILYTAKSFDRKTNIYLKTPGFLIMTITAIASGILSGASFYYGTKPSQLSAFEMAAMVGVFSFALGFVTNIAGFYITGILPNSASEAENLEQNMWDEYLICKTKPAAYQLLEWYAPLNEGPTEMSNLKKSFALKMIEKINIHDTLVQLKKISTQHKKIELAFRYLEEAKQIILLQRKHEDIPESIWPISFSELGVAAKNLNYFK